MDTRDMDRRLVLTHYRGAKAVFLIEDDSLNGIWLETKADHSRIGEIYVGKIKSVADGIGAAFVEYEKGLVGFLPLAQIKPDMILNRDNPDKISPEQELLVQVYKDPMKHKDATLTTDLLFSGKYLILTPVSPGIRFSRKLKREQKKALLAVIDEVLTELFGSSEVFLSRYGLIVRTNAVFAGFMELFYELHELFHNAGQVKSISANRTAFTLLYRDCPFYQRVIRDQYDLPHIRIYTDDAAIKEELEPKQEWDYDTSDPTSIFHLNEEEKNRYAAFMQNFKDRAAPESRFGLRSDAANDETTEKDEAPANEIILWNDPSYGLLQRYNIASEFEKALSKRVWLRSGGFLIIEPTEALTVIDVNSGKAASRKKVPEEFNLRINLEAAYEIARQLKLRNLSGIIIVDFINLDREENREELLHELGRLLRKDPIGAALVDMTGLGLVEITRKKTEAPLAEKAKQLSE